MRTLVKTRLTLVLGACALLAACGDKAATPEAAIADSNLLQYVPADTPYVIATLEPMPDEVYEKFEAGLDGIMNGYRAIIKAAVTDAMKEDAMDGESSAEAERVTALLDKLSAMMTTEGMRNAGIERDSLFALYGSGVLPVVRITLADTEKFEAAIADIETEAGEPMATATLDDLAYRYAGDDKGRFILAVHDGQALMTVVPTSLSDDAMRDVLGLNLPARNIADSGRLQALAETYGFTAHALGIIDIESIASVFLTPQTGVNAEVLGMAGYSSDVLSEVCKAEFGSIAGIAPRIVTGYTDVTTEHIASNTVFEMRRDIADGLATLPAPVPGLGKDHGGLFSFGMSIDLLAAREFYTARLDAMEADPYECELLADLQAGVAQGRAVLQQPIPPMVYGVKGFVAVIDELEGLDIGTKQPPTSIDMRFLLATENAPGLVAMGTMFSPELAALNLQPDGKAVKVESPQLQQGPVDEAWAAMTENALSIAVGNGSETKAAAMLTDDAGTPPPFMSTHMDAGRYYSFIGEAMEMSSADAPNPEVSAAMGDLMSSMAMLFDRVSVDIQLTDRGIEMPSVVTLAE